MAGMEQLCYDLGWRGPQPGRASRGNPADLESQLKVFLRTSGDVGRSPEKLAKHWLLTHLRNFDHLGDFHDLVTWKKDRPDIKDRVIKIFRILMSGASEKRWTFYQPKLAQTQSQDCDEATESNDWPGRRQHIAQSPIDGPIKRRETLHPPIWFYSWLNDCRLLNKDPPLIQELLRNGFSDVTVHPSKASLIAEFQQDPTNYPGRRSYRRDNQPKAPSFPIYFATTLQEVHAERFAVTKNHGGWVLTDGMDLGTTGPCIYVVPSAGNGGNQRGYHGWLGGDQFTKDPIARTLGETVMRARAPETSSGNDTEASHLKQSQAQEFDDEAASDLQVHSNQFQTEKIHAMRPEGHTTNHPSATAASVIGEIGSRSACVSISNESQYQKRKRSLSPPQQSGDFNRLMDEHRINLNTQDTEGSNPFLPKRPVREISPLRGPLRDTAELQRSGLLPQAGGEASSNAKKALSTLTNNLTLAVITAERLDAKLVKNTEALVDATDHMKALLPLASSYLAISEAGVYPKHQENLDIVRKAINVREDLKNLYNETNDERKSPQGRSTVSKHIFTHTEEGAQAPASIIEWASSSKTTDLIDWAQYANAGLEMGNARRKTRH